MLYLAIHPILTLSYNINSKLKKVHKIKMYHYLTVFFDDVSDYFNYYPGSTVYRYY